MQSGRFANGMGGAPPASLSLCRGVNAERDELQALWNGERCPGINDAAFTFIENGSGVYTRVREGGGCAALVQEPSLTS